MDFELKKVLETAGPSASLIFASWIFLQLLNQRYQGAYDRYRALLEQYRQEKEDTQRHRSIGQQILLYKRRCEQMRFVTNLGVTAAILLLTALAAGAIHLAFETITFLKWVSLVGIVVGLVLVIAAASVVLLENTELQEAIESELSDVPDLREAANDQKAGHR